jgi:hypothetical protein
VSVVRCQQGPSSSSDQGLVLVRLGQHLSTSRLHQRGIVKKSCQQPGQASRIVALPRTNQKCGSRTLQSVHVGDALFVSYYLVKCLTERTPRRHTKSPDRDARDGSWLWLEQYGLCSVHERERTFWVDTDRGRIPLWHRLYRGLELERSLGRLPQPRNSKHGRRTTVILSSVCSTIPSRSSRAARTNEPAECARRFESQAAQAKMRAEEGTAPW